MRSHVAGKWRSTVLLVYFALLAWWTMLLLLSPLILLYGFLLLCCVWFGWHGEHKDVLVVSSDNPRSRQRLALIMPLLQNRANVLNWSERNSWSGLAVAPQLFRLYAFFFGPEPFARDRAFPIVIVLGRFQRPKAFSFPIQSARPDSALSDLQAALRRARR